MLYKHGQFVLEMVSIIQQNKKQDIEVCRDIQSPVEVKYIVWIIHDNDLSKSILSAFENREEEIGSNQEKYDFFFVQNQTCIFGFRYKEERNIFSHLTLDITNREKQRDLAIRIVEACMATSIPMPILYCILNQRMLNLDKGEDVYFGMDVDISELDESHQERDCVEKCIQIILEIEERYKKKNKILCQLLEKRRNNQDYGLFQELYRDVQVATEAKSKADWKAKIITILTKRKDRIFKIVLTVTIITTILGILALLSMLIFGDIPWLRIFTNDFREIGTVILGS